MLMVLENYPKDGILASIAMVVVAISLTTTLALLIARLFETRPTVRHGVLASALVCSLATPVIALLLRTSGTSTFAWNLLPPAQRDEPARDSAPPPPPLVQRLTPRFTEEGAPESAPATTADAPAVAEIDGLDAIGQPRAALSDLPQQSVDWQTVLRTGLSLAVTVWAIGSIAMFVRIVCGSIQVHRIRRGGRQFLVDSRGTIASHLRRYLGTEDLPAILISDAIESPVATGVFRSAVILPAGLVSRISTDQLCDVLIHECAHVLRRDPLMLYLRLAAASLFWPIPFIHLLNSAMNGACEEICDNYVLTNRDPLRYAETLVQIATLVGNERRCPAFVGMLHLRGKLEMRIAALIADNRNRSTRADHWRAGLCLSAFLLASIVICGSTIHAERVDFSQTLITALPRTEMLARVELPSIEPNPTPPPPVAEPIEIELWLGFKGAMAEAFKEQVQQFNEGQDRVALKTRFFENPAAVQVELDYAFVDGRLPDLAIVDIPHVVALAADNRIAALDDTIAANPSFQIDDLLPGILTSLRYGGKLYALPVSRSTPVLFYNKDRFIAAGLDPNTPPATWQEVREMSATLTSDDGEQYGFAAIAAGALLESMIWSNGGELLHNGKAAFAESAAAPLQLMSDMVHLDATARFAPGCAAEFISGRAAMAIDSAAQMSSYVKKASFKIGTAPIPSSAGFQAAPPSGGWAAVIPAAISPERQSAAFTFIDWFGQTPRAAEWARTTGFLPIRQSASDILRYEGFYQQNPHFEVAIRQVSLTRDLPPFPAWEASRKVLGEAMSSVVCANASAMRILKNAETQVNAVLDPPAVAAP